VLRPGLRVRARRDFSDLAKPTEVTLRNESLLFFGGGEESRRLRLTPGAPQRAGIGKVAIPLTVDVPVDALTAFPAPSSEI
jgi:hypothetical protein